MLLVREKRSAVLGIKLFRCLSIAIENNLHYFHNLSESVVFEQCSDRCEDSQKKNCSALPGHSTYVDLMRIFTFYPVQ